jgi:flavin reductase (DIM6/NTAB) family NADH-FMN oxidoreductase RutF
LPPLIAVACKPSSFTLELALASKAFSLCLLDRTRLRAMQRLASVSGRTTLDKLADAGLVRARGARLGVPVVKGAVATIECQLHSRRRLGDHVLLVGLVKACHASKEFAGFWDFRSYRPILYAGWRGGMTTYEGA